MHSSPVDGALAKSLPSLNCSLAFLKIGFFTGEGLLTGVTGKLRLNKVSKSTLQQYGIMADEVYPLPT